MNKNKNFIATSDQETYQKLKDLGFQEINFDGKRWIFLNDKANFAFDDNKDVHYTNKLCF